MKVRAKSVGFYNGSRVRPGAVFELLDPKHFSDKWMEKVAKDAVTEVPKPAKDEPIALSELGKKPKKSKADETEVI